MKRPNSTKPAALTCITAILIAFVFLCSSCSKSTGKNALSLWNDTAPAKKALIEYVKNVTNKKSPDFIPVEDRIEFLIWTEL